MVTKAKGINGDSVTKYCNQITMLKKSWSEDRTNKDTKYLVNVSKILGTSVSHINLNSDIKWKSGLKRIFKNDNLSCKKLMHVAHTM